MVQHSFELRRVPVQSFCLMHPKKSFWFLLRRTERYVQHEIFLVKRCRLDKFRGAYMTSSGVLTHVALFHARQYGCSLCSLTGSHRRPLM